MKAKASFGNNVDTNGDIENALSIILCTRKKLASNFDSSAKTAIKIGTELYVAVRPKIVSYLSK